MYSGDGQHLFVSGSEANIDEQFTATYKGMGLSIVDVEDGSLEAHLFKGMSIHQLQESQDGTVYVVGSEYPDSGSSALTFIARFDPDDQEILAKRSFKLHYEFLFVLMVDD
jgi:hypothetical protein